MLQIERIIHDDIVYDINKENKTASVVSNNDENGEIIIPRSIEYEEQDYIVKAINEGSFKSSQTIKSIIFPANSKVETIEKEAFADSSIENVFIPSSVIDLKKGWCRGTSKLTSFNIAPNNKRFTYIDDKMLVGKSFIESDKYDNIIFVRRDCEKVAIPSFIKNISAYAFSETLIETVSIAPQVTHIHEGAFYKCKNLHHVHIPFDSKLQVIKKLSFSNAPIKDITIPSTVSELGDWWLINKLL